LALLWGAAANIPYTGDGLMCHDAATIKAATGLTDSQMESCLMACKRVYDTIEAQKNKGCEKTARDVHTLMLSVDGTAPLTPAQMIPLLEEILNKNNCLHDLELHLNNREKFCTHPGRLGEGAMLESQTKGSVLRRFALQFSHYHLVEEKQVKGDKGYCFPAMLQILSNPAANAFTQPGPCKDILTHKWKAGDCSGACWQSIKDAAMATGTRECCLAKYYDRMFEFTYGSSVPLTSPKWDFTMGNECNAESVPCTTIYDAVDICIQDNAPNDKAAELFKPGYCSVASSLAASLVMSVAGMLSVLFAVSRN